MPRPSELLSGRFRSILLMIISTVSFAIMNASIRDVTQTLEPMMVVFFRNFLGLFVLAPFFIRHGLAPLRTERLGLHWVRAGLNLFAMAAFYIGLSLTPLAEATALAFTAPLFAVLLAICLPAHSSSCAPALQQ